MVMSSSELNEALCCICRACSVTLAMWSPRYPETRAEPSSAALNFVGVSVRPRAIDRAIAASSVRPQPKRDQADSIHVKCQPASRNPQVKLRRRRVFHDHPRRAERLLLQTKPGRQDTPHAEKDRGWLYHEPLPDFSVPAGTPIEPPAWAFGPVSGAIGRLGLMLMSINSACAPCS
jgi:hypothetical protein